MVPLKRPQKRIKIIEREVVPFERAAGPTETIERELAPLVQSGLTLRWPRWRPKLGRLALGSLALAVLGGLSLVMLTMLVCAAVGLWSWSGPNEADTVARRPMIRSRLAPLATMPLLAPAEAVVELATPLAAVANPTAPPVLPTATPMPPPPTAAPPAAASQATSKPKLTSLVVLNVRAGPGVDHPVVGKLAAGQSAAVTGQNPEGTWWQIEYPAASGGLAWVSANPQYSTVNRTGETLIAQGPTPATGAASPPASTPATQAPSSPTAAARPR